MTTLFAGTSIPVGTILAIGGNTIPDGFLLCDGSEINRNDYSELFTAIGTFWGSGNGTTTFRIPTTQGLFLRGRANGSTRDPDRASRTAIQTGGATGDNVGSYQADNFASHTHNIRVRLATGNTGTNSAQSWGQQTSGGQNMANNTAPNASGANMNESSGGNETRPKNVYVNYIIKY